MKNKKIVTLGFVSVAMAISLLSTTIFASSSTIPKESSYTRLDALSKFSKVLGLVEKYNVDEVTLSTLIDKALQGMMTNLDAHSNYLTAKEYKELQVQTSGEFGGLGISVGMKDGALTVIAPISDTPADKVGMKAGDIILKIDSKSTIGMKIDEAVSLMRGESNTSINLTVVRKGEGKPLKFHIIRDIISIQSVYAKTIGKDILYLRITSFDKKVARDIKKAILKHHDRKAIVLDLRNNPGGLLDQAVKVVDMFVDDGVIVSQKGRDAKEDEIYNAHSDVLTKVPMVVLVNAGSASASEIVSGALQDHKRAIIVGTKTFGKGSVQVVWPITSTEAVKLTIARYYLPSGRTIQAVGITPDIKVEAGSIKVVEDSFSIKEADLKKHLEKELAKVDGKKGVIKEDKKDKKDIITPKMLNQDSQLKEAVDILKALMITKG